MRTVWDEVQEQWYVSIIDVIEILTGADRPRKYWNDLKKKLAAEGSELSEKIGQFSYHHEMGIPQSWKGFENQIFTINETTKPGATAMGNLTRSPRPPQSILC